MTHNPKANPTAAGVAKHSLKKKPKAGNKERLLSPPWKIIKESRNQNYFSTP
jgi:hypothetical protein